MVFNLLSSICRQFLVGLARLAGGSSRESVSTLVETSPAPQFAFASRDTRGAVAAPDPERGARLFAGLGVTKVRTDLNSHGGTPKSYRFFRQAARTLWQPLVEASRGRSFPYIVKLLTHAHGLCAAHARSVLSPSIHHRSSRRYAATQQSRETRIGEDKAPETAARADSRRQSAAGLCRLY